MWSNLRNMGTFSNPKKQDKTAMKYLGEDDVLEKGTLTSKKTY